MIIEIRNRHVANCKPTYEHSQSMSRDTLYQNHSLPSLFHA